MINLYSLCFKQQLFLTIFPRKTSARIFENKTYINHEKEFVCSETSQHEKKIEEHKTALLQSTLNLKTKELLIAYLSITKNLNYSGCNNK